MKIQLMRLERWAEEKYGHDKPSVHTLRRWAREALIYPAPVKQGRSYFVQPDAEYMDFSAPLPSSLIRRIHEPKEARSA